MVVATRSWASLLARIALISLALSLPNISNCAFGEDEAPGAPAPAPKSPGDPSEAEAPREAEPGEGQNPAKSDAPTQPQGPVDLRALFAAFRGQLALHQKAPSRGKYDRAAVDAWRSILKPRARRMTRRVEWFKSADRWLRPTTHTSWIHLAPKHWTRAVREIAALYTELGGAMNQYETVRVKVTSPLGLGSKGVRRHNPHTGLPAGHHELRNLEHDFDRRLRHGRPVWKHEIDYYWRLAHYVQAEIERREAARIEWEIEQAAIEDKLTQLHAGNQEHMEQQRETLQFQMLSLRAIVATLQAAEENRIRNALSTWKGDASVVSDTADLLERMRDARLEARSFEAKAYAKYGSLLRLKWARARTKILKSFDKLGLTKDGVAVAPEQGKQASSAAASTATK